MVASEAILGGGEWDAHVVLYSVESTSLAFWREWGEVILTVGNWFCGWLVRLQNANMYG